MRAKLDAIRPYHRFAGILFKTAADPASPLNPFSDESQPLRQEATALFARVVEGSTARLSPELMSALPDLLWTYHMGVVKVPLGLLMVGGALIDAGHKVLLLDAEALHLRDRDRP